ncbi:hypothetical protein [Microbacterium sp. NPDC056234]|uniref:hypothetical protein n=1 Tax=Microbacterium sp. NPDC056234 TaxID=3345757 RepID=UPI0035E2C8D4
MIFTPNGNYRRPAPIEVPPGEPLTIPSTTITVAHDARGFEVGYFAKPGVVCAPALIVPGDAPSLADATVYIPVNGSRPLPFLDADELPAQ